ncbi:MAG: hypothetical protein K9N52_00355 [Verrucomicrobia bacterium]|nr:hypothetical protein [Verrucomicrobiota bacterium]
MARASQPVELNVEQINELNRKLSKMRHNINNYLSLVSAAAEVIQRKPEAAQRVAETLSQQPEKISEEMREFSREFEEVLKLAADV